MRRLLILHFRNDHWLILLLLAGSGSRLDVFVEVGAIADVNVLVVHLKMERLVRISYMQCGNFWILE